MRLRPNAIEPVAQNVHVSGQPDCEETQTERRPSRYRISTASTGWPSAVRKSVLTVPSATSARSRARASRTAPPRRARAERERQVRHRVVARDAARRPLPDLAGAVGGLPGLGEVLLQTFQIHGTKIGLARRHAVRGGHIVRSCLDLRARGGPRDRGGRRSRQRSRPQCARRVRRRLLPRRVRRGARGPR